jgi:hypothetical protein
MKEQDSTRNNMDVKLYCSKHPDTVLNFSHDLSKIGASSAYCINVKIVVHPCERCLQELERIENAVGVLFNLKNKTT